MKAWSTQDRWLLLCLFLLMLLTALIKLGWLHSWDQQILARMAAWHTPAGERFFLAITELGSLYQLLPAALLVVGLLWWRGKTGEARFIGLGLGVTIATTWAIKLLIDRPRPAVLQMVGEIPVGSSYPSAHSAQVLAFFWLGALVLAHRFPARRRLFLAVALLVAGLVIFSRLYLQVHFPTDLLGGVLVAIVSMSLARSWTGFGT